MYGLFSKIGFGYTVLVYKINPYQQGRPADSKLWARWIFKYNYCWLFKPNAPMPPPPVMRGVPTVMNYAMFCIEPTLHEGAGKGEGLLGPTYGLVEVVPPHSFALRRREGLPP